jgi:hypothetical protein
MQAGCRYTGTKMREAFSLLEQDWKLRKVETAQQQKEPDTGVGR